MAIVYLALGSNLGDRNAYLAQANTLIQARVGKVLNASPILETEPWDVLEPQQNYLNQVLEVESKLAPLPLLILTQQIELDLGRIGKGRKSARTIDIDILYYDNATIDLPNLMIPHPLAHLRAFVLESMVHLAPQLLHPKEQKTQKELQNILS